MSAYRVNLRDIDPAEHPEGRYMPLVAWLAGKACSRWARHAGGDARPDELLGAGWMALMDAARNYRPELGGFASYARAVVARRLWRELVATRGAVRVPPGIRSQAGRLHAEGGIAAGRTGERARAALRAMAPTRGDEELAKLPGRRPERAPLDDREMAEAVLARCGTLEREIVSRHWGLSGRRPETLAAIGASLGMSRQLTFWHEKKARTMAREMLAN